MKVVFVVPLLMWAIGFMNETGLVLYVYPPSEDDAEESCLTVIFQPRLPSRPLTSRLLVLHQFIQRLSHHWMTDVITIQASTKSA
jgi:hypothetical protein